MQLRVISADDWVVFRALRLRALADSPNAFGVTLAEATSNAEPVWRDRASGPGPVILAFAGHQAVAMGGLHAPERSDEAFVWGMWVEPEWRGRGLGGQILQQLVDYADPTDRILVLHVTAGNDARNLYEAHGFMSTGEWQPLRAGSEVRMQTMRRSRDL